MESNLLALIIDYQMTRTEAKAWKIAILYIYLVRQHFPDYKHYQVCKGDPRRSHLFRHCYKLIREGRLQDKEYRPYISAQLQILKHIDCGGSHPLISPNCLVGEKAWNRWLVWKKKFHKTSHIKSKEEADVNVSSKKIINDLIATKQYLISKFTELTEENIINSLKNRNLFKWTVLGFVSPYYLALSPLVNSWGGDLLESFAIDLSMYKANLTQEVRDFFSNEF